MLAGLFFTYGFVTVVSTVNALRKPVPPTAKLPPLWLPAMLVAELAPYIVLSRGALASLFVWTGGLTTFVGRAGVVLVGVSLVGMIPVSIRNERAVRLLGGRAADTDLVQRLIDWFDRRPRPVPEGVELDCGLEYAPGLTVDLYRPTSSGSNRPMFLYLHGGSWTGGDPHRQARTLFHQLAREGWLVLTARYPLSPAATFPDHLVGVKQAIVWAKQHAPALGGDPGRLVIGGGSAGGHLAALAALTAGDPTFQPGFETADTSVRACVPMYGIYDFLNRHRTRHDWPVIPRAVMKATPEQDPGRYAAASPLDQISVDAPAFVVVHGSYDSLVPPDEAHHFVDALRATSRRAVHYLEVFAAQHGFDAVASPRTRAMAVAVARRLEIVLQSA